MSTTSLTLSRSTTKSSASIKNKANDIIVTAAQMNIARRRKFKRYRLFTLYNSEPKSAINFRKLLKFIREILLTEPIKFGTFVISPIKKEETHGIGIVNTFRWGEINFLLSTNYMLIWVCGGVPYKCWRHIVHEGLLLGNYFFYCIFFRHNITSFQSI